MLNNKEKTYLRKIAYGSNFELIKFNVGKDKLKRSALENLKNAIKSHEIIKISFLQSINDDKNEFILDIVSFLNCDVVEHKGNTILLYKSNKELKNHITIPKNL